MDHGTYFDGSIYTIWAPVKNNLEFRKESLKLKVLAKNVATKFTFE